MSRPDEDQVTSVKVRLLDWLSDCEWHCGDELGSSCGDQWKNRIDELRAEGYAIQRRPNGHGKRDSYLLLSLVPGDPRSTSHVLLHAEWDDLHVLVSMRDRFSAHFQAEIDGALERFETRRQKAAAKAAGVKKERKRKGITQSMGEMMLEQLAKL